MEKENKDIEKCNTNEIDVFVFKEEFFRKLEEEKNKCIRSILWTSEIVIPDKKSHEFFVLRKSVLDSINELCRKLTLDSNKIL